jgi:hypothetical protein
MKHWARACRFLAALVVPVVCSGSLAIADTVTLDPVALGSALDLPPNDGSTIMPDGQYDTVLPAGDPLYVWKVDNLDCFQEYRTLFEFALPPELLAPGVSIHRATMIAPVLTYGWAGVGEVVPGPVYLNGYAADATVTLEDFEVENRVSEAPLNASPTDFNHRFEVGAYLASLPGTDTARVGFVGVMGEWKQRLEWDVGAQLQVEYSPASPTHPGLSVFSPSQDAQYYEFAEIPLLARASDAQDGRVDEFIQWEISRDGHVGWQGIGGDQSVVLPLGTYQIRVSVMDSEGNIVTQTRSFTVVVRPGGNAPPTLTITSPVVDMELLAGIPTPLRATASDPEDGDVSQNIRWITSEGIQLGEGASINPRLTAGTQRITAYVNDSGGRHAQQDVNVTVLPDPHYCVTSGTSATTYWINRMRLNYTTQDSGSSGGYSDFTGTWINAVKGSNQIEISAANGRVVYWTVWIDLNRDGVFSSDEALAKTRAAAFRQTINIPATAITGVTRMRVAMRSTPTPPACGVAYSGETEDYTVVIQ